MYVTWFIPALTNSRLGSPLGLTGEDGTTLWPYSSLKKSTNVFRTRFALNSAPEHLLRLTLNVFKWIFTMSLRRSRRTPECAAILLVDSVFVPRLF